MSSIVAATGYSGLSVYSATKAALTGFTRARAREVGPLGITVNCVAPGFIQTDMTGEMSDKQHAQIVRRSALQDVLHRCFDLERIAQKIRFRRVLPRDLGSLRRTLAYLDPIADAIDNPFEDTHILAVSGPHEFPVFALTEPVDAKDTGELG